MIYTQDQKDLSVTVRLPAWQWRMIAYALDQHIENRDYEGFSDVAERYSRVRKDMREQLQIESTGDLPVHTEWADGR